MNKSVERHVIDLLLGWHTELVKQADESGCLETLSLASRVYNLYVEASQTPLYTGPQLQQFFDYEVIPLILTNSTKSS